MTPTSYLRKDPEINTEGSQFNTYSKYHLLQVFVAFGAALSSLAPGMSMGFSAVALPQLRRSDDNIITSDIDSFNTLQLSQDNSTVTYTPTVSANITDTVNDASTTPVKLTLSQEEAAWFTSVTMATTPFGCLLSGYLSDRWGRKAALISVSIPGLIGWLLLATVPSVVTASTDVISQLIAGRVLNGIAIGMAAAPACILAGETSAPCLRGAVLCVNSVEIWAGILLVYLLGDVMPEWRVVAAFGAILTGVVAMVTLALPESPVWLRSKGRFGDADWVCSQLGLRAVNRKDNRQKTQNVVEKKSKKIFSSVQNTFRLLLKPRTLRPLMIIAAMFAFQQAAGVFIVTFNAVEMSTWSGIGGAVIDGNMTAILIGTCILIVVAIVCIFIDRWGRRPTAIVSGIGMAVSMSALAAYVYFSNHNPAPEVFNIIRPFLKSNHTKLWSLSRHNSHSHTTPLPLSLDSSSTHAWVPISALLSWSGFAALGFIPLPWALPTEMFPVETRGIGSGIVTALAYVFGFMALRIFSTLLGILSLSTCLFGMAVFAAAGAAFVAMYLPETRGVAIDGLKDKGFGWKEVTHSLNMSTSIKEEGYRNSTS